MNLSGLVLGLFWRIWGFLRSGNTGVNSFILVLFFFSLVLTLLNMLIFLPFIVTEHLVWFHHCVKDWKTWDYFCPCSIWFHLTFFLTELLHTSSEFVSNWVRILWNSVAVSLRITDGTCDTLRVIRQFCCCADLPVWLYRGVSILPAVLWRGYIHSEGQGPGNHRCGWVDCFPVSRKNSQLGQGDFQNNVPGRLSVTLVLGFDIPVCLLIHHSGRWCLKGTPRQQFEHTK